MAFGYLGDKDRAALHRPWLQEKNFLNIFSEMLFPVCQLL